MSGTNAHHPPPKHQANRGHAGIRSHGFGLVPFHKGSERIRELGAVPAVHTKVRDGIATPSTKNTLFSVMLLTRVLSRTSTPRRASTFCVYRPRLSPSSGRITEPECTSITRNISSHRFG